MANIIPQIGQLADDENLRVFGAGEPVSDRLAALEAVHAPTLFGSAPIVDPQMLACCKSGLWLANHFLDESHEISQRIDTPSGSWWHGIMHRREGDFSNAKYWFRSVGAHPAFEQLVHACEAELETTAEGNSCWEGGEWDPFTFVDLCEAASRGDDSLAALCGEITRLEWLTLFEFCFQRAV